MLKALEKEKPYVIGACQALGVTVFCALVAIFFHFMAQTKHEPGFFGFFAMLMMLVFSAAVTGSIVFGYPAYLALVKNKIKEALTILSYTLLFSFLIILVSLILIINFF